MRKPSTSARGRATVAKANAKKRLTPNEMGRRRLRGKKRGRSSRHAPPVVETVFVDVIEEPVPGVAVVTEFEAIEMHEPSAGSERLEDSQGD